MAKMIKTRNHEERLKVKKKIRHFFTLDRTMMIIQTLSLVYLVLKTSGLALF